MYSIDFMDGEDADRDESGMSGKRRRARKEESCGRTGELFGRGQRAMEEEVQEEVTSHR